MLDFVVSSILESPDYVGYSNGSIEYSKIMRDGEILKIAVRESQNGVYFASTMYPLQHDELDRFMQKNTLVK
jgi:hypothetical protein